MKASTILLLIAAVLAVLLKLTTSNRIVELPSEVKVARSLYKADRLLKTGKVYKRTASSQAASTCDSCSIPEVDNAVVIKRNKTLRITDRENTKNATKCAPYNIPVRLPTAPWAPPLLPYADLHRCLGSNHAFSNYGYHCQVKTKEEIHVQYYDYSNAGFTIKEIVMYNHTSCSFECQKVACGPNEVFVPNYCQCRCSLTSSDCGPRKMLHQNSCQCKCSTQLDTNCKGIYKSFNHDTCQCECDKRIKDICTENNLVIDPVLCQCTKPSKSTSVKI